MTPNRSISQPTVREARSPLTRPNRHLATKAALGPALAWAPWADPRGARWAYTTRRCEDQPRFQPIPLRPESRPALLLPEVPEQVVCDPVPETALRIVASQTPPRLGHRAASEAAEFLAAWVPLPEGWGSIGSQVPREPLVVDPSRKGREGGQGWIGCLARRLLGLRRDGA